MLGEVRKIQHLDANHALGLLASARDVTVVIPVYNGGDVVKRCLDSVLATDLPHGLEVIVIDDASPDVHTQRILSSYQSIPRLRVLKNEENLGYTKTVNRGLAEAGETDVILLNSDTEVGPLWIQRLRLAAYSGAKVAAVSAVSDNAGALAVPVAGQYNDWSSEYGWRNTSRAVLQRTPQITIEAATIHGFCVYLRRDALGDVGTFDEDRFPRGYGEENDWSMRARERGWTLAIAPQVMVHHEKGASFGPEREQLMEQAGKTVDSAWPHYRRDVREWMSSPAMREMREHFVAIQSATRASVSKPRRAYVVHMSGGGTPATNIDLMTALEHDQESFLLTVSPSRVEFSTVNGGLPRVVESLNLKPQLRIADTWRTDLAVFLARIFAMYSIELVHIRHLINQPLETLPTVLERLGIPFIVSTHDFYYVCPSVNLIDGEGKYCGGVCTPGNSRCSLPSTFVADAVSLKHDGVYRWRERAQKVFAGAQSVVATTVSARDVYTQHFPELSSKVVVIEHGRDDLSRAAFRGDKTDRPAGPLRIFCPANWGLQKGAGLVAELIEATSPLVEWHLAGKMSAKVHPLAVDHGPYARDDFGALVESISPDLGGIFSIAPETFSHTLSELWSMGLTVLSTDLGAVGDRVREKGGGVLFDVDKPEDFVDFLRASAQTLLRGESLELPAPPVVVSRSRTTMAGEYLDLYARASRMVQPQTVGVATASGRGAPFVRIESKLQRYFDSPTVAFRAFDPIDYALGLDPTPFDSMLVQRDALKTANSESLRKIADARGIRITADFDDDLYSEAATERSVPDTVASARRLLSISDSVVVSTEELGRSARKLGAHRVIVHPNLVDESAWSPGEPSQKRSPWRIRRKRLVRWVYWGTNTHAEDLELLKPVFEALGQHPALRIELDVIGVTEADETWFNRIHVPRGSLAYRDFAHWLALTRNRRHWHGGVAPLADDPFNLAKSDLKVLEYTFLNLGSIASNIGPYALLADRGLTVCDNTVDSWSSAIAEASSEARFMPSAELARYAREERSLKQQGVLDSWLEEILPSR